MQSENPAQGFSLFEKRTRFQKRPRELKCACAHFSGRKCRVRFFALLRFSARKTAFFGSSFSSAQRFGFHFLGKYCDQTPWIFPKISRKKKKKVRLANWKCEKSSRLISNFAWPNTFQLEFVFRFFNLTCSLSSISSSFFQFASSSCYILYIISKPIV